MSKTISVSEKTKVYLTAERQPGETYSQVIQRLLDEKWLDADKG